MDPRFSGESRLDLEGRPATRAAAAEPMSDAAARDAGLGPPRVWTALVAGVAGMLIAQLIAVGLVVATMALMTGDVAGLRREGVKAFLGTAPGALATLVSSGIGLVVVALAAGAASHIPLARRLGLVRPAITPPQLLLALAASLGVIVVGILLTLGLDAVGGPGPSGSRAELVAAFRNAPPGWAVVLIAAGALAPGIGEELLFRGYVQTRLVQRWPAGVAIGITAVLFAAWHGDVAYALFALPAGVWLGYVAWRTGSVLPSMACHACANASFQSLIAFGPDGTRESPPAVVAAAATAAVLAVLAIAPAIRSLERVHRARVVREATA